MQTLTLDAVPGPAKYTTKLLHDAPALRVVEFALADGQSVKAHSSPSTVVVVVVDGRGALLGRDGWTDVTAGQVAVFAPGEEHAFEARSGALRLLATIAPGPHAG